MFCGQGQLVRVAWKSEVAMSKVKFVHWRDGEHWLGYLEDFPDYWTQGESLEDLKEYLRELYRDLTSGEVPGIRKVDELTLS
jgi:hypothetical protein